MASLRTGTNNPFELLESTQKKKSPQTQTGPVGGQKKEKTPAGPVGSNKAKPAGQTANTQKPANPAPTTEAAPQSAPTTAAPPKETSAAPVESHQTQQRPPVEEGWRTQNSNQGRRQDAPKAQRAPATPEQQVRSGPHDGQGRGERGRGGGGRGGGRGRGGRGERGRGRGDRPPRNFGAGAGAGAGAAEGEGGDKAAKVHKDFDRKSGMKTTRHQPIKKAGGGRGNWGTVKSDIEEEPVQATEQATELVTEDGWGDENASPEAAKDASATGAAPEGEATTEEAEKKPAAEPEPKEFTLEQHKKQQRKQAAELAAKLAPPAPRKLEAPADLSKFQSKARDEPAVAKVEKKPKKEKSAQDKSVDSDLLGFKMPARPIEGADGRFKGGRREGGGRGGRGRGRGRGGRGRGNQEGQDNADWSAEKPAKQLQKEDFPTLGGL